MAVVAFTKIVADIFLCRKLHSQDRPLSHVRARWVKIFSTSGFFSESNSQTTRHVIGEVLAIWIKYLGFHLSRCNQKMQTIRFFPGPANWNRGGGWVGSIKKGLNEGYPAFSIQQLTFFILQQVSIQGKLCQLDDVCEKPPGIFLPGVWREKHSRAWKDKSRSRN